MLLDAVSPRATGFAVRFSGSLGISIGTISLSCGLSPNRPLPDWTNPETRFRPVALLLGLRVVVGTARTYFVVAELAATASGQVPNQFRVTRQTGPSASVVEDRTFDLPVRLACPADVSSIVRQVVPVELSGFAVE